MLKSPSLNQGKKFNKYQNKIENSLDDSIEGFTSLTEQTNNVINKYSQTQNIDQLRQEYANTLKEYEKLLAKINGSTTNYINRVNPNNQYLGKNIIIGKNTMYVTKQGVAKWYPTKEILASNAGKNGCPLQQSSIKLNLPWKKEYETAGATIPTKPTLITGTPMTAGQSCGNEGTNVYVNKMMNNPKATYEGCYADNTSSPLMTFISSSPNYTYEQCKNAAVENGYQYFSLQNVNNATSQGLCAVSNNNTTATSLGPGLAPNGFTALWSSKTSGQTGNTAILSVTGALSVLNSSGASVYGTPNSAAQPSNFLGCYGDTPNRAMALYNNSSQQYNNAQCQQIAQQNGYAFYGLQNSTSGTTATCGLSNDFAQTTQYGIAGNCTKISDGSWSGGGWSNAVYNTSLPQSNYFLILQDDGNMVIYRGTSPSDNQGLIWAAGTNGKQQDANPNYVSTKGKYSQNWIASGSTLASGDFIGSTSGNMALIMQSDGNLVLYTFNMASNCQKMADGNMGGGVGANAIYDIGSVGNTSNMYDLAYIDQNSELHSYSSTNTQYSNTYSKMSGNNVTGNDISGASIANTTAKKCETICNNNPSCAGFTFSDNVCYPKSSIGAKELNSNYDLYVRNKSPLNQPLGIPSTVSNIDSITYQNYVDGGNFANKYGISQATSIQKKQLEQLQTKMNLLSNQINLSTSNFQSGTKDVGNQSNLNVNGISNYLNDLTNTNVNIVKTSGENQVGIQNILKDSDIVVLQKNYDYLFWSILAAGTVLVSMNIMKKE